MRYIRKGAEPHELLNWKRENKDLPENLTYAGGNFPREAVRLALLEEQNFLCAYTMRALRETRDCHIEHFLPQSRGVDAETITYQNMLACHPGSNTQSCEFGAHAKADYDPAKNPFCSPLNPATPEAFRFLSDGRVEGVSDDANITIKVLNLNHPALVNDRHAAMRGILRTRKHRPLSAAEARRVAERSRQPDGCGHLPAYCEVIAKAALRHAEQEEARARRMKGARQGR